MTDKQTTTLILFAQNYSLQVIAKKQSVSLATIRERIKSLSKNHCKEFDNTMALRNSYKRLRDGIRNTDRFKDIDRELGGICTKF
jgi:predicted DNA-binding protein YlxM (UPF0122 family)